VRREAVGNTGDMVVVVADGRDSRARRWAQREAICWMRSASTLAMGSDGSITFGCPHENLTSMILDVMVADRVERERGSAGGLAQD
jgi:hypothetical protein